MDSSPYQPPATSSASRASYRDIFFVAMTWLAAALAVIMFSYTVLVTSYNYVSLQRLGAATPVHVPLLAGVGLICTGGLVYAAICWRRRRMLTAVVAMLLSILAFGAAPFIVLPWLYGVQFS